jgi:hypothetical protein
MDKNQIKNHVKELADLYCMLKNNEDAAVNIFEAFIFGVFLIFNLIFWLYKNRLEKKKRSRVVTLNA